MSRRTTAGRRQSANILVRSEDIGALDIGECGPRPVRWILRRRHTPGTSQQKKNDYGSHANHPAIAHSPICGDAQAHEMVTRRFVGVGSIADLSTGGRECPLSGRGFNRRTQRQIPQNGEEDAWNELSEKRLIHNRTDDAHVEMLAGSVNSGDSLHSTLGILHATQTSNAAASRPQVSLSRNPIDSAPARLCTT